jgi:hypothetical protein
MKLFGFLLLLAGWFIVLAAIVLLSSPPSRAGFVSAGIGVECVGLTLVVRGHLISREEER